MVFDGATPEFVVNRRHMFCLARARLLEKAFMMAMRASRSSQTTSGFFFCVRVTSDLSKSKYRTCLCLICRVTWAKSGTKWTRRTRTTVLQSTFMLKDRELLAADDTVHRFRINAMYKLMRFEFSRSHFTMIVL